MDSSVGRRRGTNLAALGRRLQAKSLRETNIGCMHSRLHHRVSMVLKRIKDHKLFQSFIIFVIFVAAVLVGIATYPVDPNSDLQHVVDVLDTIVLAVFVMEVVIKLLAEGRMPWMYFCDAWNVFDFIIVVLGLLPINGGSAVTVLRLIRLLRVLKLVRALPKLRVLVMGLLMSMSSIVYIGLLLAMLFYLYAVLGVSMFAANDPIHMGSMHIALLTLFRCATLEDWSDVMYTAMYGCDNWGYGGREDLCVQSVAKPVAGLAYFVSFVLLANFMILNLFIGVITTSMAEAKDKLEKELLQEEDEVQRQERIQLGLTEDETVHNSTVDVAMANSLERLQELVHDANLSNRKVQGLFHNVSHRHVASSAQLMREAAEDSVDNSSLLQMIALQNRLRRGSTSSADVPRATNPAMLAWVNRSRGSVHTDDTTWIDGMLEGRKRLFGEMSENVRETSTVLRTHFGVDQSPVRRRRRSRGPASFAVVDSGAGSS